MEHEEFVTLVTPAGCPGVSYGGVWYSAMDDRVRVPAKAVPELTRWLHGNRVATEADEPRKADEPRGLAQTLHMKKRA